MGILPMLPETAACDKFHGQDARATTGRSMLRPYDFAHTPASEKQ
jgi:hypothetical protein